MTVTRDGRRAYIGCRGGSILVFDLENWKELGKWPEHEGCVLTLKVSEDGSRLVSGGNDGVLRVWDTVTGKVLNRFRITNGGESWIHDLTISPNGKRVAYVSMLANGMKTEKQKLSQLRILDAASGEVVDSYAAAVGAFDRVQFLGSETAYAHTTFDGQLILWDASSSTPVGKFDGHYKGNLSLSASPDGKRLLTLDESGTARLWDVSAQQQLREFVVGSDLQYFPTTSFSANGDYGILNIKGHVRVVKLP